MMIIFTRDESSLLLSFSISLETAEPKPFQRRFLLTFLIHTLVRTNRINLLYLRPCSDRPAIAEEQFFKLSNLFMLMQFNGVFNIS